MTPGLITYQSATYGKVKCAFESTDKLWNNPYDAMSMAEKIPGKFCFWHVAVVEGTDVNTTQICLEKFVEMKTQLSKELGESVEKFEISIASVKRERDAVLASNAGAKEKQIALKTWCAYNRGQINLSGLQAIIKYWQYDEQLHAY